MTTMSSNHQPGSPRQQLKAVLWDFGGVFTASPFQGLSEYAQSLGTDAKALRQIVFGIYDEDSDHPWHKLERGEQSMADTAAQLQEVAEQSNIAGFTLDGFFQSMRPTDGEPRDDRSQVVEMVRKLRAAGFLNGIITNNIREFSNAWRTMIPVDELFETVVDSSAEGMRKPNPKIYLLALERLGQLAPEQAVFLDDVEDNVEAARKLGIKGIRVDRDPAPALAELAQLTGI